MKQICNLGNKKIINRLLFFIIGTMTIALGVALTVISNFGTGAWDAVSTGLYNIFGLSIGIWVNIVAVMLIVISGILLRRIPQISTLATSLLIGTFIDIWIQVISNIPNDSIVSGFLIFMAGLIFISLGTSIYLVSNLPPNPIDYIMLSIRERFNLSVKVSKTLAESIGICIGILVGGPVRLGTIIMVFSIGPMIEFFMRFTTPLYKKISGSGEVIPQLEECRNVV